MSEPKVLYEWELAGYRGRIVEVEPGIVTSEHAMDDDKLGRLWLSNRSPFGWQNEMIHLALANEALAARHRELVEALTAAIKLSTFLHGKCSGSTSAGHFDEEPEPCSVCLELDGLSRALESQS